MTRFDLIKIIENFLHDTGEQWAWDDFMSSPNKVERIEEARLEIMMIEQQNPTAEQGWCSDIGLKKLEKLAERIKGEGW